MRMIMSALLGTSVHDDTGRHLGSIRDLWLPAGDDTATVGRRVMAIVVSPPSRRAALAYLWGYSAGRARAPKMLRRLLSADVVSAGVIPAESVTRWGNPVIVKAGTVVHPLPRS